MNRTINSIVITGGTGTVAYALIQQCIAQKIKVLVICHRNSSRKDQIPKDPLVKVLEANIDEYQSLSLKETGNQKFDAFVHLAWMGTKENRRNDMDMQVMNIQGSLEAVRLAHRLGCRVFMGSGSQAEYGRVNKKLTSKTPVYPENGYGMAKLCAGEMTRQMCSELNMDHIWVRILSTYGPGDWDHTIVSSSIKAFCNNEPITFTKGEQIWDLIYCEDEAKILLRLLESGMNGKVYCIGTGNAKLLKYSICEIYEAVKGIRPASEQEIGIGGRPYSGKEVMRLETDITELEEDIGCIEFTPLKDGVKKTMQWMKKNQLI